MGSYRVVEIVTMPENRVYITRQVGNEAIALLKQKYKVEIWDSEEPIPKETLLTAVGGISALFCTVSDIIDAGMVFNTELIFAMKIDRVISLAMLHTFELLFRTTAESSGDYVFRLGQR